MSIKNLVSRTIEKLRRQARLLAVLDGSSSLTERAKAAKDLLGDDPSFWMGVAKGMIPKKPKKVVVATEQVAKQATVPAEPAPVPTPKPGAILSAPVPMPAKPLPGNKPERVMRGKTPAIKPRRVPPPPPPSGDFAARLSGAARELGLEDKSPLGQFRKFLSDVNGHGKEYWDRCYQLTETVLVQGLLKDEADWKLLVEKLKGNLFFDNGKSGKAFLAGCPKDLLSDLLLGLDGLTRLVAAIRVENGPNPASPSRITFIMDACAKVGKDADIVLENCKHVVNRMKQRKFISADHALVGKVAAMRVSRRRIPPEKYVSADGLSSVAQPPAEPVQTDIPEPIAEASGVLPPVVEDPAPEPSADELSDEALEKLTRPDPVGELTGGKPVDLNSAAEEAFRQRMMAMEPNEGVVLAN